MTAKVTSAALVVVGCVWFGWLIVANTMADFHVATDAGAALSWRPAHPAALVALAEEKLRSGEAAEVASIEELAARAILANPLDQRALRALALAAEMRGDGADASRIMQAVGKRSRRDAPAQIWLLNRNLADGRFPDALINADALLRTRPDLYADLAPLLLSLTDNSRSRDALVEVMTADPLWRPWFLDALSRQDGEPAKVFDIYVALQGGPHPPGDAELSFFLVRLVAAGRYELAYLTWLHFLSPEAGQQLGFAYNGEFEQPLTGLPFDWVIGEVHGATTEVVETAAGDNRILRVQFANTRVPYRHVSKLMLLPPGRYRLSGSGRADGLENERGMVWRVSCAESEARILGETERLSGTTPWRPFAVAFEVPQSGCRAQWLRLHLAARTALEEQVGGEVLYDGLVVERVRAGDGTNGQATDLATP